MVYVVPKADPKQTSQDKLDVRQKDDVVEGVVQLVDGHEWLKLDNDEVESWILIAGKAVGLGQDLLVPVFDHAKVRRKKWKVAHSPHVYVRDKPQKEGSA